MAPFPWGPQALSWGLGPCCLPRRPSAQEKSAQPAAVLNRQQLSPRRLPRVYRRQGRWRSEHQIWAVLLDPYGTSLVQVTHLRTSVSLFP